MATKELEKEKVDAAKQLHDTKSSKQEKIDPAKSLSGIRLKRKPLL